MRVLTILLITLTACCGQSGQSEVDAVLKQLERAEQTGDFDKYAGLWTREKAAELENIRRYARARPEVHYRVIKTFVQGDDAVLLAQLTSDNFVTMLLRKEDGQWKIQNQAFRNTAPNVNSVYALLPPAPGSFARAGSHWEQIAPAVAPDWQLKAVFDEAYLYIRIESNAALPAPGSTTAKSPGVWPVLKIDTSDAGEFVMFDAVNVGDQATFDEHGKANSHRPYASYMIRLEQKDHEIFSTSADLHPSPLLDVTGRDYDIRIPLKAMGIQDSRATKITIGDAQWPKSVIVSLAVQRYPR